VKKQKAQSGFTLLELLVVLAIIGLLASVVIIATQSARSKARDAKRAGDVRQIMNAMEQYHIANNVYPTGTLSILSFGPGTNIDNPLALDSAPNFVPQYIAFLPVSPLPADGGCSPNTGLGNNNYWYSVADDGSSYNLVFCVGAQTGGLSAGVHTATSGGIQ